MAEDSQFHYYFEKLNELVAILKAHPDLTESELPPGINEQLEMLRKNVSLLKEFNQKVLDSNGISQAQVKRLVEANIQHHEPRVQNIVQAAEKLKKEVQFIYQATEEELKKIRDKQGILGRHTDQKSQIRHRQNKFRQMGGGNWIRS